MLFADSLNLALRAITAQRLRSFLTLLGIAVGIAAVILLTSIGEGIHRFVLGEFSQFGTNNISAVPGKTKTGGAPSGLPSSARPLTLEAFVNNITDEEYLIDAGNTGDSLGLPTLVAGPPNGGEFPARTRP